VTDVAFCKVQGERPGEVRAEGTGTARIDLDPFGVCIGEFEHRMRSDPGAIREVGVERRQRSVTTVTTHIVRGDGPGCADRALVGTPLRQRALGDLLENSCEPSDSLPAAGAVGTDEVDALIRRTGHVGAVQVDDRIESSRVVDEPLDRPRLGLQPFVGPVVAGVVRRCSGLALGSAVCRLLPRVSGYCPSSGAWARAGSWGARFLPWSPRATPSTSTKGTTTRSPRSRSRRACWHSPVSTRVISPSRTWLAIVSQA